MFKTKRKRAVVLALIAFFCTAATTYVAVDWKRFGGGFLAFLKGGKSDSAVASSGGASASKGERMVAGDSPRAHDAPLARIAAAGSHKHADGAGGAPGKPDEDLFKYGDPAAGIPPGSFIVAQNDTPAGDPGGAPEAGGTITDGAGGGSGGGSGVTSPAPPPAGTGAGGDGSGDTGLNGPGNTPSPPPAGGPPAGPPSLPPVSSIPETSSLAMMGLGALFLAAAAARKRQQG